MLGGVKKYPPKSPEQILTAFQRHMSEVLGLAPKTCQNHSGEVSHFLDAVSVCKASDLEGLTPLNLTSYLTERSAQCQPSSLRQVAGSVRQFLRLAQFWLPCDSKTEIPPSDYFGPVSRRRAVHIYSPEEVGALLEASTQLGRVHPFRARSFRTVVGLLE